jgi:hypothetical protein
MWHSRSKTRPRGDKLLINIKHGHIAGTDTAKLESRMRALDWRYGDDDPKYTVLPLEEAITQNVSYPEATVTGYHL